MKYLTKNTIAPEPAAELRLRCRAGGGFRDLNRNVFLALKYQKRCQQSKDTPDDRKPFDRFDYFQRSADTKLNGIDEMT